MERDEAPGAYAMDFPSQPPHRVEPPAGLADALGERPVEVWAGRYVIAILGTEAQVRALAPDITALGRISAGTAGDRGNIGVAAAAERGGACDVVDRFFAPGSGIAEDPATGSLHCILTPLFASKLDRDRLRFHQAFPGRGGDFDCSLKR